MKILNYYEKQEIKYGNFSVLLKEESENNLVWMLILGDLLSLLLAFFILIYIDKIPVEKLWQHIVTSVNMKYSHKDFNDIESIFKKSSDFKVKESSIKTVYLEQVLKNQFKKIKELNALELTNDNKSIKIFVPHKIIFDPDSKKLTELGTAFLTVIANSISKFQDNVRILGINYETNDNLDSDFELLIERTKEIANFLRIFQYNYNIEFGISNLKGKAADESTHSFEIIIND
ncbi:MAG: hypothetical protein J0H68_05450 [Sphingobacteriia bacterium]|nr:hypothetical protein [Sphingobacteriia bacterium]